MATMQDTRGLAWWLFWRYALASYLVAFIAGAVVGFIIGFCMAIAGAPQETTVQWSGWASMVAGIGSSFFVLNFLLARMLGRVIGGRKLALIES